MKAKKHIEIANKKGKLNFIYSTSDGVMLSVCTTNIVLTDTENSDTLELIYTFCGCNKCTKSFPTLKEAVKELNKFVKRYEPLKIYK